MNRAVVAVGVRAGSAVPEIAAPQPAASRPAGVVSVPITRRTTARPIPASGPSLNNDALPDKDFDPAGGYNEYALTVEISIAGSPEMVAQNRRDPSGDQRPTVLDGTSCLSRSSSQELPA